MIITVLDTAEETYETCGDDLPVPPSTKGIVIITIVPWKVWFVAFFMDVANERSKVKYVSSCVSLPNKEGEMNS